MGQSAVWPLTCRKQQSCYQHATGIWHALICFHKHGFWKMSGISTHIQNLIRGIMIIKENWEQGKVRFHTSRRLSMCPDRGMGVCLVFASADLVQSMWWICFFLLYSKSVSTQASSFIINIVNISKLDQLYVLWITMAKSFIFFIPHSPKMAFAAVGIKSIVCVCLCIYL